MCNRKCIFLKQGVWLKRIYLSRFNSLFYGTLSKCHFEAEQLLSSLGKSINFLHRKVSSQFNTKLSILLDFVKKIKSGSRQILPLSLHQSIIDN